MFWKKKFVRKELYKPTIKKEKSSRQNRVIWAGLLIGFFILAYVQGRAKTWAISLVNKTAYIASITIGKTMEKDEITQNINVLLVWYGGDWHDGALLTDSIVVASYNPTKHYISLVSIPRDLLVPYGDWQQVKINSILSRNYMINGGDIHWAIKALIRSVNDVSGLSIPYYLLLNFDEFIGIVDMLWGIDIYVPEHFIDREFPIDWSGETEIFELFEGRNHLSGPNTLKYARSRHSTSDFSRSQRQQDIIQAILKRLTLGDNLSISKIRELRRMYSHSIITNISFEDIVWLAKYGTHLPTLYQNWYTNQCIDNAWRTIVSGCLIDNSGGSLVSKTKTIQSSDPYKTLQDYARLVTKHPISPKETAIIIYNASDKDLAWDLPYGQGIAWNLANKMLRYGLPVKEVENSDIAYTGSFVRMLDTEANHAIVDMLPYFLPISIDNIIVWSEAMSWELWSGYMFSLYLGDDYLQAVWTDKADVLRLIEQEETEI